MRAITSTAYSRSIDPAFEAGVGSPSSASLREHAPLKQASLDGRLRALYEDLLRQPAPSHLVDLIEALAGAEGGAGRAPFPGALRNVDFRDVSAKRVGASVTAWRNIGVA
ncbi:NepR family anti-sigma factor [Methylocystis sp. JAN1]|uniref:NepR family anti-sigma factor n=1 Tax=Methylocystis sp. JAN1 TaxID=3397211 RepID=UPI003FA24918